MIKKVEREFFFSHYSLGKCYYLGSGVSRDYAEAFKWYRKSAEQGNANAQYTLGFYYYLGSGVSRDHAEAVKWYRKSAEHGNARAQYQLGLCYALGKGVSRDQIEAVKWYRKSAEQGDADAQNRLGYCYENGSGVPQDYAEAVSWYRKAAEQGDADAEKELNRLEEIRQKQNNDLPPSSPPYIFVFPPKSPYYIFFDTETTGLPKNYNAACSDTENWPRLVQLAWILTDEEGHELSSGNEIVKPDGFIIPYAAFRVHGISTERAKQEGKSLRDVIGAFLRDANKAKCLVGHNVSFDQKIIGAELYRLGIADTVSEKKSLCTMKVGTDFCKIPGYYGYKYKPPKLQELHEKLFGVKFEDAHDAMVDIKATAKCFWELSKRKLI